MANLLTDSIICKAMIWPKMLLLSVRKSAARFVGAK